VTDSTASINGTTPAVAVVVSTFNRSHLLPRLVAALEAQQDALPFEVVVVDDASTDDTATVLDDIASTTKLALIAVHRPTNGGPGVARDGGWRAASAPRIAFTDDDCVPEPRWLAEICRGLDTADIVQGRTRPNPEQVRNLGPFSRTLEVTEMNGFFQTCNVGYRREWLQRVDGFDPRFEHSCEDADLARRMIDAGARPVFAADAVVRHDIRPSSALRQLRDAPRWQDVPLVIQAHPDLRAKLHARYFWKRSHPVAIAAALGLLAAAVPGRPRARVSGALLALPYIRHRLYDGALPNTGRRRRRLGLVPAALAVDVAEVAVLAAASLRRRTPVL
jgi:GT2 family glycosyltransferase